MLEITKTMNLKIEFNKKDNKEERWVVDWHSPKCHCSFQDHITMYGMGKSLFGALYDFLLKLGLQVRLYAVRIYFGDEPFARHMKVIDDFVGLVEKEWKDYPY